jgi:hypothetical protein
MTPSQRSSRNIYLNVSLLTFSKIKAMYLDDGGMFSCSIEALTITNSALKRILSLGNLKRSWSVTINQR